METKELKELREYYREVENDILMSVQKAQMEDDIDFAGDSVDEIQGKSLAHMRNHVMRHSLQKLSSLQNAIKKIDEGNYGLCEACEEEIPLKRLQVLPGVSACVKCAEEAEFLGR